MENRNQPTAIESGIISELWHLSRTALAGIDTSRYARKVWWSKKFAKTDHAIPVQGAQQAFMYDSNIWAFKKEIMAPRSFLTSNNEVITGPRLAAACEAVATQMEASAIKVREEDAFASHVTQSGKDDYIDRFYTQVAAKIRNMENLHNFSVWQRVNMELTGDCVAFLA